MATTIFTVPTDRTAILKSLWVQNQGANTCAYQLSVVRGATTTRFIDTVGAGLATRANAYFPLWVALVEGDVVKLLADQTNHLNYWLSGALLDGDPT